VASQTLLKLIARLQQGMTVTEGRALLLDYARRSCGARLALLFEREYERQMLALLAHSGRHPHPSSWASGRALPLQGLFASALGHWGLKDIPNISREPLALPEERALAWPQGRVLLHSLSQGQRQGVLVFCFSPAGAQTLPDVRGQEELLICISLLSAYLGREDMSHVPRERPGPQRIRRQRLPPLPVTRSKTVRPPAASKSWHWEEIVRVLTALCEQGLMIDLQDEPAAAYEQMVHLLCAALQAPAGILWRYQPEQRVFLPQASWGELDISTPALTSELDRQASSSLAACAQVDSGLLALSGHLLVWHLLCSRERLQGALGLLFPEEQTLSEQHHLLLQVASDVLALVLLHAERRRGERQAAVQQERTRLAHELHDSVVQDVAHVTQKLDYIQRTFEQQPGAALAELDQARTILRRSLRDLRSDLAQLVPGPLAAQEFDEALKALLHEYRLSMPHLKITTDLQRLALWPQALQAPAYRLVQEALQNIRTHASASEVRIRLRQVGDLGVVQVSDNGQGFVPEELWAGPSERDSKRVHLGLASMEERVRQAGGVLEIHSRPGQGTTLKARFPLTHSSAILTEREREVLHLLVDGLTNRAISERLSVSLETVKSHVHHIMQKMHVRDRTQAAVLATRQQWL